MRMRCGAMMAAGVVAVGAICAGQQPAPGGGGASNPLPSTNRSLQQLINAALPGATVSVPRGNYVISGAIVVYRPVTIDLNDSTIMLSREAGYPNNAIFFVHSLSTPDPREGSRQPLPVANWSGAIPAGTSTFAANAAGGVNVGDAVWVELGTDPVDASGGGGMAHWCSFARVLANDGKLITLDRAAPYDINLVRNHPHRMYRADSIAENVIIRNGHLASDSPDGKHLAAVWIDKARNVTLDNLTIEGPGVLASCMTNLRMSNIVVNGRHENEPFFWGWQMHNVVVENCEHVQSNVPCFSPGTTFASTSFEGLCENVSINNLRILNPASARALASIDSASHVEFGNIRMEAKDGIAVTAGRNGATYHIAQLDVAGEVSTLDLSSVERVSINGQRYRRAGTISRTFAARDLAGNPGKPAYVSLPEGLIASISTRVNGSAEGRLVIDDAATHARELPLAAEKWVRAPMVSVVTHGGDGGNINGSHAKRLTGMLTNISPGATVDVQIEYLKPE